MRDRSVRGGGRPKANRPHLSTAQHHGVGVASPITFRRMPSHNRNYGDVIGPRLDALEAVFGPKSAYLVSPVPSYLGGGTTFGAFPDAVPGGVVYCTSELTGDWGSGQLTGGRPEYELCIVLAPGSPLAPQVTSQTGTCGRVGSLLHDLATFSKQREFEHGETAGPVDPALNPMANVLFVDLTNPKKPLEYLGSTYGIMLAMLITTAEQQYLVKHGSAALIKALRAAKAFPISSLDRTPVA